MAATLSHEQMLGEIIRQDEAKLDLVADTRRMSAKTEDGIVNLLIDQDQGVTTLEMNDYSLGQVSGDLKIPKPYFDRMRTDAPGLFDTNINHWLQTAPKRKLVRGFKPTIDGLPGTGRAWLSDRYKRLDNVQIARKIFPVFDTIPGLTFHQAQLTDSRFYLRALLPGLQAEIKVGDVVQAGVAIGNSEVGNGMLKIEPFVWRLRCLNGLTVPDSAFSARHVGGRIKEEDMSLYAADTLKADDEAFWLKARDQVSSALTEVRFREITDQLREIVTGETIQAPVAATETLANKFGFTEDEREALLRNLVKEGDLSQWGALNAVTATARDAESFDRQAEMEEMGWQVAQMTTKEWAQVAVTV